MYQDCDTKRKQVELRSAKLNSLSWVELNWVELRLTVVIIPLNLNWIELKIEPTSTLSQGGGPWADDSGGAKTPAPNILAISQSQTSKYKAKMRICTFFRVRAHLLLVSLSLKLLPEFLLLIIWFLVLTFWFLSSVNGSTGPTCQFLYVAGGVYPVFFQGFILVDIFASGSGSDTLLI